MAEHTHKKKKKKKPKSLKLRDFLNSKPIKSKGLATNKHTKKMLKQANEAEHPKKR